MRRKNTDLLVRFKPAADKSWLFMLAGVMWSGVGVMLVRLAISWLIPVDITAFAMATTGIILALVIHRFGFSRLALRNIKRIIGITSDAVCIFAFQGWTSYPLVVVMISLGIFLRKFSPIPKPLLAAGYIGIGGGLFLSSFHYYVKLGELIGQRRRLRNRNLY